MKRVGFTISFFFRKSQHSSHKPLGTKINHKPDLITSEQLIQWKCIVRSLMGKKRRNIKINPWKQMEWNKEK